MNPEKPLLPDSMMPMVPTHPGPPPSSDMYPPTHHGHPAGSDMYGPGLAYPGGMPLPPPGQTNDSQPPGYSERPPSMYEYNKMQSMLGQKNYMFLRHRPASPSTPRHQNFFSIFSIHIEKLSIHCDLSV